MYVFISWCVTCVRRMQSAKQPRFRLCPECGHVSIACCVGVVFRRMARGRDRSGFIGGWRYLRLLAEESFLAAFAVVADGTPLWC